MNIATNDSKNISVGFIGCGEIAHLHAECLQRLGVRIAGGFDVSGTSAEGFVGTFGGQTFESAQTLCASDKIDAVYICTRHDSHVGYIDTAARAGKAVFCEKPLALDPAAAERAAGIVAKTGIRFALGFNHRYSPGISRLKLFLDSHEGGFDTLNVHFATAPFLKGWAGLKEQGGGVVAGLGSHVLDLVHYLTPGEISLAGSAVRRRRLPAPYLADTFAALLTSDSGQLITIHAHDHGNPRFSTDPGHRINTVHAFAGGEAAIAGTSSFEWYGADRSVSERYPTDTLTAWGYAEINRRFIRLLSGAETDIPGIQDGLFAAAMVEAIGMTDNGER